MIRPLILCLVGSALLAVGACNSRGPAPSPSAQAGPTVVAQLPAGSGCSAVVARYRAVAKSDAETGNAGPSVYAQMDREISGAEAACAAGRDGRRFAWLPPARRATVIPVETRSRTPGDREDTRG